MADRYMKNAQHHPSQVNANQKYNEEAQLPEWPLSKEKKTDKYRWDMEKLDPEYTFNGNKNGVVAIGNSTGVPQII